MAKAKKSAKSVKPQKVQPPARPPECNLATEKGMAAFREFQVEADKEPYEYHCDLAHFLRTLEHPPLRWGDRAILLGDRGMFGNDVCLFKKGRLLNIAWRRPQDLTAGMNGKEPGECTVTPVAALVDCETRTKANKDFRLILLLCGDDDDENGIVAGLEGYDFPTISFRCLSHFYDDDMRKMLRVLNSGTLSVLDYTPDETKPLTKAQKEKLKKFRRKSSQSYASDLFALVAQGIKPPKPGFTMINVTETRKAAWHRAGTVLLSDGKQYILMGRDGDQYFGCQLPDACSTISDAQAMLRPPEAEGCRRQGEWYAIPVNEEAVPAPSDCVLCFEISGDSYRGRHEDVFLPLDHPDGNKHFFADGEGRVGKDGTLYVYGFTLSHEQHDDLTGSGWFTFIKNTAVRSFSEGGVD